MVNFDYRMRRFFLKKRILSLILLLCLLVPMYGGTAFGTVLWPSDCYVASEGACLIDADSGAVLFGKNAYEAYYPASITKVMTALLTLENCEDLSEMVTFSEEAVTIEEENSTIIGASAGDQLSVLDCLYSLLFQSANEVANALAEHVGAKHPELKEEGMSDRDVFVSMMNTRAEELGCVNTHFNNPSGLTDPDHYTSPYDMCLIMAEACRNEDFIDIESRTYWTHAPIKRYPDPDDPWNTVYPKHSMLKRNNEHYYEGAFAGKTGYTTAAGNTLVTACERDGMRLIVTVMDAHNNHYNDTKRLFDFGYDNFESLYVNDHDSTASMMEEDLSVGGIGLVDGATLAISSDAKITIPRGGEYSEVTRSLEISDDGSARIVYYYGDMIAGSSELMTVSFGSKTVLSEAYNDPLFLRLTGNVDTTKAATASEEGGTIEESAVETETVFYDGTAADTDGGLSANAREQSIAAAVSDRESEETESGIPRVTRVIMIVLAGVTLLIVAALIVALQLEKREARARERRRKQRLRHTRDLTSQQSIKMDMLVQQSLRKNKRKRKR